MWNSPHVEGVEICGGDVGAERKGEYYDHAGALKEVVRNHLLQVLWLVAMTPPVSLDDLRDHKVDLLRSVRSPTVEEVTQRSRRTRYIAGCRARPVNHAGLRGGGTYRSQPENRNVPRSRLEVDNWRWQARRGSSSGRQGAGRSSQPGGGALSSRAARFRSAKVPTTLPTTSWSYTPREVIAFMVALQLGRGAAQPPA